MIINLTMIDVSINSLNGVKINNIMKKIDMAEHEHAFFVCSVS
jgi:hypothetical protein